jgi:hypothetical protein
MNHMFRNRSRLLVSCGGAALALALAAAATERAEAQAFQATPTEVVGTIDRVLTGPGTERITVNNAVVVVDWQPDVDNSGNALDFLPTGHVATFVNESDANAGQSFAILNRILPSPNGNVVVFDGTVISRIIDEDPMASGAALESPGGFVAFYSPTGILVGGNALFDVGQLLLTTLDPDPGSFANFAGGGNLSLVGATGSTARVQINPGARILATPENAFFAVVAADVEMRGSARVNGSHAYVAGEVVNLSLTNGLFNISIPVGTAAGGEVVTVDGTVGGPASSEPGDNHMIYGVARAAADPISMLFRGNLGFDPVAGASVVNGQIILSANYNVSGEFVGGGFISDGINATFSGTPAQSDVRADIFIDDFVASSSLLAIGTHRVQATAVNTASSVAGNLLLVGDQNAEIFASNGQNFTVTGDLLVDARDYGAVTSGLQTLDLLDAEGGFAVVNALEDATITVEGDALVTADAFGGVDIDSRTAGSARAGTALIGGVGGTVNVTGSATLSASASGISFIDVRDGAEARGGVAQFYATQGGTASTGQDLTVRANADGAVGSSFDLASVSNAFGGQALVSVSEGGGTVQVDGLTVVTANARGGISNNPASGSTGDAGQAVISVDGLGTIELLQAVRLEAQGFGGENFGGRGGAGLGGRALASTSGGGTIFVGGRFDAFAPGFGGEGQNGGDGFGGLSGAYAVTGTIDIRGLAVADSAGFGGDGGSDFNPNVAIAFSEPLMSGIGGSAGDGGVGRGGTAFFRADGTLTQSAVVSIGGNATILADGYGGAGGDSDGQAVPAGRGGDAFGGQVTIPNQADPAFTGGATIVAGGGNGTITVVGNVLVGAAAFAGEGGDGIGTFHSGRGGDAFGGFAQAGVALLGPNGALSDGVVSFGNVQVQADGFGGSGGFSASDFPTGDGGNGVGGTALLTVEAGTVTAGAVDVLSRGYGGDGPVAGFGQGGRAALEGGFGGTFTANRTDILALGFGGFSGSGSGGNALGGVAAIEADGLTVALNGNLRLDASAIGGGADGGAGGNATGGDALLALAGASTLNAGLIALIGNGVTTPGGRTEGGTASLQVNTGSTAQLNASELRLQADGLGADPADLANVAGQFFANIGGGSVNLGNLIATGLGDAITGDAPASQLAAVGGNLNVADQLLADAIGDIAIQTGQGGIIGGPLLTGATTTININTRSEIAITGDGIGASGLGGRSIGLNAGRSILLGGNVAANNGNVSLVANNGTALPLPAGQTETAAITMAEGSLIKAGTGAVSISLLDGDSATGAITLASINAGRIDVRNFGTSPGSDIVVRDSGILTASATGRAIDLASLNGEVLNFANDLGLVLTGGGHYAIFAATPTGSQIGSFGSYQRRYNVPNAQAYDALDLGGNFAAFRIAPVLTVTADNVSRSFGSNNPAFTATYQGFQPGDSVADLFGSPLLVTIADSRSSIGVYTIDAAPGSLLSQQGYQFAFSPGQLTVVPRPITVTADNLTRIYGNANPALTFTVGGDGLLSGDQLTGALATAAGVTTGVGITAITQGTLRANENYALTFIDGQLTITPRALTITADDFSRIYGNANPALTFSVTEGGLINGDKLTGALTTAADATTGVGTVAITQGTLTGGPNYAVSFVDGQLTITPRAITVTADDLSRIFGNANPALTFRVGGDGLVNGDQLPGALATTADVTTGVGTAAITQGTLTGGPNYALSFIGGQLTITPRPITVTADDLSRIYGNANPALTFTVGGAGLANGDQLSGALATTAGATTNVGNVAITQGTLTGGPNYAVSFVNGQLTITPRALTVTADDLSRIYGNANPALTFTVGGDGLVNGDQLTGALATTAGATTGVGTAAITQGTLAATSNYALTFVNGQLTITPRALTITADDLSRIYGNTNPALTFTVGGDGLVNGDQLTGALATTAGATTGVGIVAITQGTLAATPNYALTFVNGQLTITPRALTITADDLSRIYGNTNPALTFTVGGDGLVNGDQLTGALATTAGATTGVGNVAITQGTLTATSNYALSFVNGQLTITPRPITVTADNLAKLFTQPDPALTFKIGGDGLVNNDSLSGSLARDPGERPGDYAITRGTLDAGRNYTVTFTGGELTINPPPLPSVINNPILFSGPLSIQADALRFGGEQNERFGIDFPENPEAGLITEDELLDEPVTSGGDASLQSGGSTPPEGAK